jgi:glycosyltransferase involved in cell wall biosynthesis
MAVPKRALYIYLGDPGDPAIPNPYSAKLADAGYDLHSVAIQYGSRWQTARQLWQMRKSIRAQDAVLTTEYNMAFAVAALLASSRSKAVHVAVGFNLSGKPLHLGQPLADRPIDWIFSTIDGFVIHSREEIDQFQRLHHLPQDRMRFSFWGFDLPTPTATLPPGVDTDTPYFLMIGRNNRDFHCFADAIKRSGTRGVIVCGRNQVDVPVGTDRLTVLHDLSMSECVALMARAASNVVLLKDGTRGAGHITVVMAMLSGKPTIYSDVAVLRDYLAAGETGIAVPLHDVDAAAAAMTRMQNDPAFAHRLGETACAYARKTMSHAAVLDRTTACIIELLQSSPRHASSGATAF